MATSRELARIRSMQTKFRPAIANGVSLISPLLRVMTIGLDRSARQSGITGTRWRNVEWDAGGLEYSWEIVSTRSTATVNRDEAATREFSEPNLLAKATIQYYNVEHTVMLSARDKALNKNDETKLDNIWERRCRDAQDAIYAELAAIPWNENETNQNGGLSMFGATSAAAQTEYAGIALSATAGTRDYWRPRNWDYDTASIAANLFPIVSYMKVQLSASSNPGGGGRYLRPDFGAMDPSAWLYVSNYIESNLSFNVNGGRRPINANLFEDGFDNMVIDGVTLFWDENYGGDTGSIEGGATDEIMFGHSNKMFIATSQSKREGFIKAITMEEQPWLSADIGVFKTGVFCFGVEAPMYFGLAYT